MTLIPDRAYKQPTEEEYLAVDFTNRLATGDALSQIIECKCYDEDTDVTSSLIGSPAIVGNLVKFWFKSGTDEKTYNLTLKVETNDGAKLEEDLILKVKEGGHS